MRIIIIIVVAVFLGLQAEEVMKKDSRIYVAGHRGLVGSAIVRKLKNEGYTNIITRTFAELDLRNQQATIDFFATEKPEFVFLAAAKVGGIWANYKYPADFIYDNLAIELNVIHAAHASRVKKLLFLGSSCIYPRECPQPMKEDYLLSMPLESTNKPYAVAKIAGIELCQAYNRQHGQTKFIACMPTNLYGPGDTFDLEKSHVLPALLAKMADATKHNKPFVEIWGTGTVYREFLYVDDLADALVFLMQQYNGQEIINVGTGKDITIHDLALLIKDIVGYEGTLQFNPEKPDGTPRKLLDVDKLTRLGWRATTKLSAGIEKTYAWCKENNVFQHDGGNNF